MSRRAGLCFPDRLVLGLRKILLSTENILSLALLIYETVQLSPAKLFCSEDLLL